MRDPFFSRQFDRGPVLMTDPRVLIRPVDIPGLPPRPAHWLPNEPMVTVMEESGGFCEVYLELGGRVAVTRVVNDDASMNMAIRDFKNAIEAATYGT